MAPARCAPRPAEEGQQRNEGEQSAFGQRLQELVVSLADVPEPAEHV